MNGQTMLKVERLTRSYGVAGGRRLTVLQEVSFSLAGGASLAIVGPSGSGKTTLLGLCAGLDRPSSGEVELAGTAIGGLGEDERARVRNAHVGFVFQNFQLVPTLTALENVLVPLELRGEGGAAAETEARALLARVGLGERHEHYPVQLSGGEQQRVAVARAIVKRPEVLLCDEPTGALDATTGVVVLDALARVSAELGATTVLITHNAGIAAMADRVLFMSDGRIGDTRVNATRTPPGQLHW